MVLCDVVDEHRRRPGRGVAAADPAPTDRAGRGAGLRTSRSAPSSSSSCSATPSRRRRRSGYRDLHPHSDSSRTTTSSRPRARSTSSASIRNGMDGAGIPVEFSKGEAGRGQHEINLVYADGARDGRPPPHLQERREGDRRRERALGHLHGQVLDGRGRLVVPHPRRASGTLATGDAAHVERPTQPTHLSTVFRDSLGGLLAAARELPWCCAPFVNSYKRYQPDSWAPTAVAWGLDNRTCGFRLVGHGPAFRVESRIPGADVQPLPGLCRASSPPACTASSTASSPRRRFVGNGYDAPTSPHVPSTLAEAIGAVRRVDDRRGRRSATTCTTTCSTPPARSGPSLQPGRHRLGAAPQLRADLTCPRAAPSSPSPRGGCPSAASATGSSRRWCCPPTTSTRCTARARSARCSPPSPRPSSTWPPCSRASTG